MYRLLKNWKTKTAYDTKRGCFLTSPPNPFLKPLFVFSLILCLSLMTGLVSAQRYDLNDFTLVQNLTFENGDITDYFTSGTNTWSIENTSCMRGNSCINYLGIGVDPRGHAFLKNGSFIYNSSKDYVIKGWVQNEEPDFARSGFAIHTDDDNYHAWSLGKNGDPSCYKTNRSETGGSAVEESVSVGDTIGTNFYWHVSHIHKNGSVDTYYYDNDSESSLRCNNGGDGIIYSLEHTIGNISMFAMRSSRWDDLQLYEENAAESEQTPFLYESGTRSATPAIDNEIFIDNYNDDLGSAFEFYLPVDANITSFSFQVYSCQGFDEENTTIVENYQLTDNIKFSVRSVLDQKYDTTAQDLFSYNYSNCQEIETIVGESDSTKGFNTFNVTPPLSITANQTYYFVMGTETLTGDLDTILYLPHTVEAAVPNTWIWANSELNAWDNNSATYPQLRDSRLWFNITYPPLNISCTEDWQPNYTACTIGDNQTLFYIDVNNCGTFDDLPVDNGTVSVCNFCTLSYSTNESDCINGEITTTYSYTNFETCCNLTMLASDCTLPANSTEACGGYEQQYETSDLGEIILDIFGNSGTELIRFTGILTLFFLMFLSSVYINKRVKY